MPPIRIATYNVHGQVGLDGRRDPERTLGVLRRIEADCVALQEFVNDAPPGGKPLLARWCERLGMRGCFAPAFTRGGRLFGSALLSRFPLLCSEEHELPAPGCHPRVLLECLFDVAGRELHVATVHLGVRERARVAQRLRLFERLREHRGDTHVLLGDFNEWHVWNHTFRWLREDFGGGSALPTFPAIAPALALDRIWVRPRERLLETRPFRAGAARYASDHLPLVATVRA